MGRTLLSKNSICSDVGGGVVELAITLDRPAKSAKPAKAGSRCSRAHVAEATRWSHLCPCDVVIDPVIGSTNPLRNAFVTSAATPMFGRFKLTATDSRDQFLDDISINICKPKITAGMMERQFRMIEAEQMQEGRMQIV